MAVQSRLRGHVRVCDILRSDRGESTRETPSGPAAANSNLGKGGFGDADEQTSSCLSMKLSKAAETQRMSHRGFQSLCHIRIRTVQLPPTSL